MVTLLEIITCIIGTLGFSVLLKVSKNKIIYTVIGGAVSAVISVLMIKYGCGIFYSTLTAMIAVTIYSEVLARIIKTPAGVILMPSTVPLLPGGSLYYTVSYLFFKDYEKFIQYGIETILTGAGIALGAVAVSILMTFIKSIVNQIKDVKHKFD